MVELNFLVLLGTTLENQSFFRDPSLPLIEEPRVLRRRGHNVRSGKACDDGNETFKKKDVPPGMDGPSIRPPLGNSSKSGAVKVSLVGRAWMLGAYPVARRPPNAPAKDAAET